MNRLSPVQSWLDAHFADLAAAHEVPGASVAVLAHDDTAASAAGVLNMRTDVAATVDSIFQIGSITKLFTATLVMQLIEEGVLELDTPVCQVLPQFRLADSDAASQLTVEHLLTHTPGFDGDVFVSTTGGDDAVRRFVEDVVPDAPQHLSPGELYSYNNVGFVLLGRIVEVLRGAAYNQVLRERILAPLDMTQAATCADEAILHRAAVGHIRSGPDTPQERADTWSLPLSNAPAGAMLTMSAQDLSKFAAMYLRGGLAPDGDRLLQQSTVDQMWRPHTPVPDVRRLLGRPTHYGLGWSLPDWPGGKITGHNGNTVGQSAYLRLAPETGVAVALLTNGGSPDKLYHDVFTHVLGELAGIEVPPPVEVPKNSQPFDPKRYVGRYERGMSRMDVDADTQGRLKLTITTQGEVATTLGVVEPTVYDMSCLGEDTFVISRGDDLPATCVFLGSDDTGRATLLHNGRANPRAD